MYESLAKSFYAKNPSCVKLILAEHMESHLIVHNIEMHHWKEGSKYFQSPIKLMLSLQREDYV